MKPIITAFLAVVLLFGCVRPSQNPGGAPVPAAAPSSAPTGNGSVPPPFPVGTVQEPQVAGQFYPADPGQLESEVRGFLAQARPPELPGRAFGLIVPHAGIRYSGAVAAQAYKLMQIHPPHRVVIIGAAHRNGYPGVFAVDSDAYRTPLGLVKIDRAGVATLKAALPQITTDPSVYRGEHSAEVQLPFLQLTADRDFKAVVLMMGQNGPELPAALAAALDAAFPEDDTLFIASTDMSHGNYPPFKTTEQIRPVDEGTLRLIEGLKIDELRAGIASGKNPLCGGEAVLTLMELYRRRGGSAARPLDYVTSGDITGDHSQVVGYGAVVFMQPEHSAAPRPFALSEEEKKELLKMARTYAEAAVRREKPPEMEPSTDNLRRPAAAFVTLKRKGELAGCIGSILPEEPLYRSVQQRAADAAIRDGRFFDNPIRPDQLADLEVEISVLTPLALANPEEIQVGRDGVLLTQGSYRGVFLPQVPVEQGWNREEYLSHLCGKAGIPDPGCWRSPLTKLERFEAIVFSE